MKRVVAVGKMYLYGYTCALDLYTFEHEKGMQTNNTGIFNTSVRVVKLTCEKTECLAH